MATDSQLFRLSCVDQHAFHCCSSGASVDGTCGRVGACDSILVRDQERVGGMLKAACQAHVPELNILSSIVSRR
jgi:hypothetical protein